MSSRIGNYNNTEFEARCKDLKRARNRLAIGWFIVGFMAAILLAMLFIH